MRTTPLSSSLLVLSLFLAACSGPTMSISTQNENPLNASRYGDELADTLANIIIQQDPLTKEPGMTELINSEIAKAKELGQAARRKHTAGTMGAIIAAKANIQGLALYYEDQLFFSSDFITDPGPSLHVYLTSAVDPRDVEFPDETAVDLGPIQTVYGAQTYKVPAQEDPEYLRTLVIWDTKLHRLYGFAQLSKQK